MTTHQDRRQIRELAYSKWEAAGEPAGQEYEFLLEAEREFFRQRQDADNRPYDPVQEASEESFPASDAPAWNSSSF